jgi:hypothetical protein
MQQEKQHIPRLKARLAAARALVETEGWQELRDILESEMVNAALQMADNPLMTEKEIDFRRGAIYATRNLISAPDMLIRRLESDLLMAQADQIANNPNATA